MIIFLLIVIVTAELIGLRNQFVMLSKARRSEQLQKEFYDRSRKWDDRYENDYQRQLSEASERKK